jgi:hypothetical protein
MSDKIKIYVAPGCGELTDRIELSSGTRAAEIQATDEPVRGVSYEEGARLPRDPWRRPTEEEITGLVMSERPSKMATSVVILKLPDELRDDLQESEAIQNFRRFWAIFVRSANWASPCIVLDQAGIRQISRRLRTIRTLANTTACTSTTGISST